MNMQVNLRNTITNNEKIIKKLYFKQKARRPHRLLEQQFYYIFYISISKISNMKFIRIIVKLWKTHIFQDLTNKKNKQYKE